MAEQYENEARAEFDYYCQWQSYKLWPAIDDVASSVSSDFSAIRYNSKIFLHLLITAWGRSAVFTDRRILSRPSRHLYSAEDVTFYNGWFYGMHDETLFVRIIIRQITETSYMCSAVINCNNPPIKLIWYNLVYIYNILSRNIQFLPLNEEIGFRAVFVIVSGLDGQTGS